MGFWEKKIIQLSTAIENSFHMSSLRSLHMKTNEGGTTNSTNVEF